MFYIITCICAFVIIVCLLLFFYEKKSKISSRDDYLSYAIQTTITTFSPKISLSSRQMIFEKTFNHFKTNPIPFLPSYTKIKSFIEGQL